MIGPRLTYSHYLSGRYMEIVILRVVYYKVSYLSLFNNDVCWTALLWL
jgi:hypothetical protein